MTYHRYNIGAIEDIGLAPYQVQGDPVKALIAQLNRFAGKTISPGGKCGTRNYLPHGALPVVSVLDEKAATTANLIVYDSLNCISDERLLDFKAMKTVNDALTNPIPWAMANLANITVRIAQFADSKGLAPASVGITTVDPNVTPKTSPTTIIFLAGVALAGAFYFMRRKR